MINKQLDSNEWLTWRSTAAPWHTSTDACRPWTWHTWTHTHASSVRTHDRYTCTYCIVIILIYMRLILKINIFKKKKNLEKNIKLWKKIKFWKQYWNFEKKKKGWNIFSKFKCRLIFFVILTFNLNSILVYGAGIYTQTSTQVRKPKLKVMQIILFYFTNQPEVEKSKLFFYFSQLGKGSWDQFNTLWGLLPETLVSKV